MKKPALIPVIIFVVVLAAFATVECLLAKGLVVMPRVTRKHKSTLLEALDGKKAKAPELPAEPRGSDEQLKEMYRKAVTARQERLEKETYVAYMTEALEWKSVGDFAPNDQKNVYYSYAIYIYTSAGEKFKEEWVPWLNVGNVFQLMSDGVRAEQAYKKAADADPSQAEPYVALLEMFSARGILPTDDMKVYFKSGLDKVSVDPGRLVIIYARYLLDSRDYRDALEIMKWAATKMPGDSRVQAEYRDLKAFFEKNPIIDDQTPKADKI